MQSEDQDNRRGTRIPGATKGTWTYWLLGGLVGCMLLLLAWLHHEDQQLRLQVHKAHGTSDAWVDGHPSGPDPAWVPYRVAEAGATEVRPGAESATEAWSEAQARLSTADRPPRPLIPPVPLPGEDAPQGQASDPQRSLPFPPPPPPPGRAGTEGPQGAASLPPRGPSRPGLEGLEASPLPPPLGQQDARGAPPPPRAVEPSEAAGPAPEAMPSRSASGATAPYTIQVAYVSSHSALQKLLTQHPTLKHRPHRAGHTDGWQVFWGRYPTLAAAQKARAELPEALRRKGVWVRRDPSVHASDPHQVRLADASGA